MREDNFQKSRVKCPVCSRWYVPTQSGLIRWHTRGVEGCNREEVCPGRGMKPSEYGREVAKREPKTDHVAAWIQTVSPPDS